MTRRVWTALRLQLLVQTRSYFLHIYLAVAVITVAGFRLFIPEQLAARLLPPFLLAEPGMLGLTLVAGQRYREKNEHSAAALVATPLRSGEYVAALVLAPTLQGTAVGLLVQAGVLGVDARLLLLAPPLFVVGAIAGLVGLALSSYASEFTRYLMVAMIPAVAIFQAPILSYFGVVPPFAFAWIPTDPALSSFAMLAHRELDAGRYLLDALRLAVFLVLAWAWALACFRERIRARPEEM